MVARAALKGFLESLHSPSVRIAALGHLRQILRNILSGQLDGKPLPFTQLQDEFQLSLTLLLFWLAGQSCVLVPEIYHPIQTAIELLGCDLPITTLKFIVQSALHGLAQVW